MVDGIGRIDSARTNVKRGNIAPQSKNAGDVKDEEVRFSLKEVEGDTAKVVKEPTTKTDDKLDIIESAINSSLGLIDTRVAFSLHRESGQVVIQVIDNETNEVLREIPPEELVDQLSKVVELVGLLVDKKG